MDVYTKLYVVYDQDQHQQLDIAYTPVVGCGDLNVGPGGFACATRGGVCNAIRPLLLPSFSFFSFSSFAFEPLRGKLPRLKKKFPQYFDITRRYL